MQIHEADLARLKSQISRGEVILSPVWGFQLAAKDRSGRPVRVSMGLDCARRQYENKPKTRPPSKVARLWSENK